MHIATAVDSIMQDIARRLRPRHAAQVRDSRGIIHQTRKYSTANAAHAAGRRWMQRNGARAAYIVII
jgi:hypothetical protein